MKKKKKKYMDGGMQKYDARDAANSQGGKDYSKMSVEQLKKLAQQGDKRALAELKKRMQQQQGAQQQAGPPKMKKGGKKKKYMKGGMKKTKKKGKKRQNLWD